MTEHRPPYAAVSHDPEQLHLATRRTVTVVPECVPPTKPDILLLLPLLESAECPDYDPVCLHLVHLDNGNLGLCNTKSSLRCPCCGFGMCEAHTSTRRILIPSETFAWTDEELPLLCETCAALSPGQIYTFYAFRMAINQ